MRSQRQLFAWTWALACAALFSTQLLAADIPLSERKSDYEMMSAETRAMQDDDTANPATFSVLDGGALWDRKIGDAKQSCAGCHNAAETSMKGVATRYPMFDAKHGKAVDLEARINICRTEYQKAAPLPIEDKDLLALTAFIARQSRGMPITPAENMQKVVAQGRAIYELRQGQLNLSCAQCHNDNWGHKLAGAPVPQGHPNGYPLYRLEWQAVGSLQRRLRNCLIGMRAEGYAYGALEYIALEAFLMWRARGMKMESPAVRP